MVVISFLHTNIARSTISIIGITAFWHKNPSVVVNLRFVTLTLIPSPIHQPNPNPIHNDIYKSTDSWVGVFLHGYSLE